MTPKSTMMIALSAFFSISLTVILNFNSAAVVWPAIDNLPSVCRLLQPDCLSEDFFTNASSGLTPRLPYVLFLSELTRVFDNGIGGGLSIIKSLLLIALPAVITFLFIAAAKTHLDGNNTDKPKWHKSAVGLFSIAVAPLFVYFLQSRIGTLLSVAWWMPLSFEATAHNLSIGLTVFGFLLIWIDRKVYGVVFIFLGALIHPAVSIFASVVSCILLSKFDSIKNGFKFFGLGLGASLMGAALVKIIFQAESQLNSQDFVRIYAFEAHPSHYIPSQFGTLGAMPWLGSFLIVSIGLLILSSILYKLNSAAWKSSFFAFVAYTLSVLVQYIFVEIYPVKLIAALGPSRFTMFGMWFLFIFCFIAIVRSFNENRFSSSVNLINKKLSLMHPHYLFAGYTVVLFTVYFYAHKSSYFYLPDDAKMLGEFASTKTNVTDVFVLPFYAPQAEFPLKTGRSIFFGNGFPFTEKYFHEWEERKVFLHGKHADIINQPGSWIGEKYANHYRLLLPKDFVDAGEKYKIDWVVIEADHSKNFSDCDADFHSQSYRAYSLRALKECAS